MDNQIVDLILPNVLTQKQLENKIYDAVEIYLLENNREWSETAIIDNIDAIKKIKDKIIDENSQPKYDREFWEKVIELNKDNFEKIAIKLYFDFDEYYTVYLYDSWVSISWKCSPYINFNEIDLINKQYRLLQEIYYSRLEEK
jgi:hypothetical protein